MEDFGQLAWKDMRTTAGYLEGAPGLSQFAGLDRQGRRRLQLCTGPARRSVSRSTSSDPVPYQSHPGANLMDSGRSRASRIFEAYYAKAEDKNERYWRDGVPGLPGNNNYKVLAIGAAKVGCSRSTLAAWQ